MTKKVLDFTVSVVIVGPIIAVLVAALLYGLHVYINTGATGLPLDKYGKQQMPTEDFQDFKDRVSDPSPINKIIRRQRTTQ